MSEEQTGPIEKVREVPAIAYEIASRLIVEHEVTQDSISTAKEVIEFVDAIDRSIDPGVLGEHNLWLRKRGIMKDALWYAAQISMNPTLLQATWEQESRRIRQRAQPQRRSITLRYPL